MFDSHRLHQFNSQWHPRKFRSPRKIGRGGDGNIQTHAGAIEFEVVNPYAGEIADFVAAIEEGRPPEVPGEEGQGNVELLCEICP